MERNYTFTGDFSPEAVAAIFSIEMILALIANGVVLVITIYQRKSWKQSSTIFFTSLILAHLLIILVLPFSITALAAGEWIIGSTDEERKGTCDVSAYILLYSGNIMYITLSLISIDRFLFIVKPHLHKRFMSPRVALVLVIIVWIATALFFSSGFINGSGTVFEYINDIGACYAPVVQSYFRPEINSVIVNIICRKMRKKLNRTTPTAGEWIIGDTDKEKKGTCGFNGFMILYCAYNMLMTLSLISIDRFLFIVKPHLHKRFMSPRVALVLVIIVLIVTAVLLSSGFINGSGIVYQYIDSQGLCYANTTSPIMAATCFSMTMILLSIIVVTSIWTFCFTRKFIKIKKYKQQQVKTYKDYRNTTTVQYY
uniref:G-protein coupled receptors family 1 profile domain-containing protein n=1 Tax=Amphimedon queenslandica TaxID=400682 RepID=A0A1X7UJ77_AMPQE